jgi:hypothetical protein
MKLNIKEAVKEVMDTKNRINFFCNDEDEKMLKLNIKWETEWVETFRNEQQAILDKSKKKLFYYIYLDFFNFVIISDPNNKKLFHLIDRFDEELTTKQMRDLQYQINSRDNFMLRKNTEYQASQNQNISKNK